MLQDCPKDPCDSAMHLPTPTLCVTLWCKQSQRLVQPLCEIKVSKRLSIPKQSGLRGPQAFLFSPGVPWRLLTWLPVTLVRLHIPSEMLTAKCGFPWAVG